MENYLEVNRESWDARVDPHVESDFYGMEDFLQGKTSLKPIELDLLGNIEGKRILHLQCHFGQDTISLSKMGAKVVGMDFSPKAIEQAINLAKKCETDTEFICADVYSLPEILDEKFDIVFSSYGTIGWLPDINKWAEVVSHFLKPNGEFIFAEFHPIVWMYDDDFTKVQYKYSTAEPIVETLNGSYAAKDSNLELRSISWNHGLAEVINALISKGIEIKDLQEYHWSPYACFSSTQEVGEGKYIIPEFGDKIPLVYSIKGQKKPL